VEDHTVETLEICVLIDSDGNYAVGVDQESAKTNYDSEIGNDLGEQDAHRYIYLTVTAPRPTAALLTGTVPEDGEQATLSRTLSVGGDR
jgi:hypothetical protein